MIGLWKGGLAEQVTACRVADDLRRHDPDLPPEDAEVLAEVLAPFIRTMPDAIAWAIQLSKDKRCGRAVAFGTGSVLLYLCDEEDLLPESTFGAVGLIDDAFLVHVFVSHVREAFPFVAPGVGYEPPEPSTIDLAAALLPPGVAAALLRTCNSLMHVAAALFAVPAAIDGVDSREPPTIRARAAAQAYRALVKPAAAAEVSAVLEKLGRSDV